MAHRKAPPGTYKVRDHFGTYRTIEIDNLLVAARHAALGRFVEQPTLTSPTDTTRYLEAALGHLEHERFCVVWLDNRHKVYASTNSRAERLTVRVVPARSRKSGVSPSTPRLAYSRTTIRAEFPNRRKPTNVLRNV